MKRQYVTIGKWREIRWRSGPGLDSRAGGLRARARADVASRWSPARSAARGSDAFPLTAAQVRDKCLSLFQTVLPPGRGEEIWDAVGSLEEVDDVAGLLALLSTERSSSS